MTHTLAEYYFTSIAVNLIKEISGKRMLHSTWIPAEIRDVIQTWSPYIVSSKYLQAGLCDLPLNSTQHINLRF